MRFDVTADNRIVTLIARRNEECSAQLLDVSRGGMRVAFADGPALEMEQDILIADEQNVSVCTVRTLAEEEDGRTSVGLLIFHSFPIARLPEKKRALWGYKESVPTSSARSSLPMLLLILVGLSVPVALLNFAGSYDEVTDWVAQTWRGSRRHAEATAETGPAAPGRATAPATAQSPENRRQQSRSTSRAPVTSRNGFGGGTSPARRKSSFTADDALPSFSGSF